MNFARFCGWSFQGLDRTDHYELKVGSERARFELLHVLEFNSKRKRMSVVLRDAQGSIRLLCKGADSVIAKRLRKGQEAELARAFESLEVFGKEGLRTLMLAERVVPEEEFTAWSERYVRASSALKDREAQMEELQDLLEVELEIVGCTAIEDKLQDEVPETIELLAKANIKLWVLTGDKGRRE